MKLFAFHCGGEVTDMAVFDPFDPSVGHKLAMPYFFYVICDPASGGNGAVRHRHPPERP